MMRQKAFDYSFMACGLVIQILTFIIAYTHPVAGTDGVSWLSLVSGCLGVCSVCLCAQGSIWTYIFGFGQVTTSCLHYIVCDSCNIRP